MAEQPKGCAAALRCQAVFFFRFCIPSLPSRATQSSSAMLIIPSGEQEQHDLQQFLRNVRKYTDPEELTAKILNDLVDRIVVHAPDKSSGKRRQNIRISYDLVGFIPVDELMKQETA